MKTAKSTIRAIASTILFCSIFLLSFSGLSMHALGHENDFSAFILGFSRDGWQHIHVFISFLFIISAIIHVVFNWKAFKNYFITKQKSV